MVIFKPYLLWCIFIAPNVFPPPSVAGWGATSSYYSSTMSILLIFALTLRQSASLLSRLNRFSTHFRGICRHWAAVVCSITCPIICYLRLSANIAVSCSFGAAVVRDVKVDFFDEKSCLDHNSMTGAANSINRTSACRSSCGQHHQSCLSTLPCVAMSGAS